MENIFNVYYRASVIIVCNVCSYNINFDISYCDDDIIVYDNQDLPIIKNDKLIKKAADNLNVSNDIFLKLFIHILKIVIDEYNAYNEFIKDLYTVIK